MVVVTATNHPELLDRAVWRRFQLRLELPTLDRDAATAWIRGFEQRSGLRLGLTSKQIAETFDGLSFAELEEFCLDVQRRSILDTPNENTKSIVTSRLAQWNRRFRVTK